MKLLFKNYNTIEKIAILRKELDDLNREREKNQKIFNNLCNNLENNMCERDYEEGSIQLSILLSKADDIYEKLNQVNEVFKELKFELSN